jgi:hypothetical protein
MMQGLRFYSVTLISALALGCPSETKEAPKKQAAPAAKPTPAPTPTKTATAATKPATTAPATGDSISGVVQFKGTPPTEKKIDMSSQPACKKVAADTMTNEYRIKDGKVQDVFVYVKNPPKKKYAIPSEPVILDQKGCRYSPKVIGVMAKQNVQIINSDPMMHNIHPTGKNSFNLAMPTQNMKIEKKFKKQQVLTPIMCDVHPWMKSYAGVVKHPFFAVTDASGAFSIKGLAAGTYTLAAVHGALGVQTVEITVSDTGAARAAFEFSAP